MVEGEEIGNSGNFMVMEDGTEDIQKILEAAVYAPSGDNSYSKLFAKFVRTEEAKKQDPNGMGIGLYFVKRIVDDHGGKVWVESEGLGRGSTFFVELPIKS